MKKIAVIIVMMMLFAGCSNPGKAKQELEKGENYLQIYEKRGPEANTALDSAMVYFKASVSHDRSNAEAFYYLGEGYSRLKWSFGEMFVMPLDSIEKLTRIATDAYTTALSIGDSYEGRIHSLHPAEKLDFEWGSLALRRLMMGDEEGAKQALEIGRSKGGFAPVTAEYARNLLLSCPDSSVLVTGGDIDTWAVLYVQLAEGVRPDVKSCSFDLMGISHYRKWLKTQGFPITADDKTLEKIKAVHLKKRMMLPGENLLQHMEFVSRQNSPDSLVDSPHIMLSAAMPPNKRGGFLLNSMLVGIAYQIVDTVGSTLVDVSQTMELLYNKFTYENMPDSIPEKPRTYGAMLPRNYASSAMALILAIGEKTPFTTEDRQALLLAVDGATETFPFVWQVWAASADALIAHKMDDRLTTLREKAMERYPDNGKLKVLMGMR